MVAELVLCYTKEQIEALDTFQNLLDRLEAYGEEFYLLRELDGKMNKIAR